MFYFTSTVSDPPTTLFMGRDKHENEDLIKWGWPEDVWFHVDKVMIRRISRNVFYFFLSGVQCSCISEVEPWTNTS